MRAIEVPEQSGKPRPGDEADLTGAIAPIRPRGYKRRLHDYTVTFRPFSDYADRVYRLLKPGESNG